MDSVLNGLKWEIYFSYLDDIIVFAKDWADHLNQLCQVFQMIREAGLKLQSTKCTLGQVEVAFLGHFVSSSTIKPDPRLLSAMCDIPPPTTVKDTQNYLGLTSYYRCFIPGFDNIAALLHAFLHKGPVWDLTEEYQKVFQTLKDKLLIQPMISYLNFDFDAMTQRLGAILL